MSEGGRRSDGGPLADVALDTESETPVAPQDHGWSPQDRMGGVRRERAESAAEVAWRRSNGGEGGAPMARLDRSRTSIADGLQRRMVAQRKATGAPAAAAAIPDGGGAALAGDVRARMEPHVGADLSHARVHTGGESATAAGKLGARAFTVGSDVHFGAGEFSPGSKEGDRLLAHELAHTVQAQRSGVQRKAQPGADDAAEADVSHPDEPAEQEADAVGDHVADALHDDAAGANKTSTPKQAAPRIGAKLDRARAFRAVPKTAPNAKGDKKDAAKDKEKEAKNAAARTKIEAFTEKTFTQKNYVTANGYGAFDLSFDPAAGTVSVTVKLEFQFDDAPPSVYMKYLPVMGNGDIAKLPDCKWTDEKKEKFKADMIANVDRVWSKQHTLKCTFTDPDLTDGKPPQWKDLTAITSFVVKPVDKGGHFKVKVVALPKEDKLRSHVSGKDHHAQAGAKGTAGAVDDKDFKPTEANFNSSDNDTTSIGSSLGGPKTKQSTTAHEFGHMIGQDDQYAEGGRKPGDTNDSGSTVSSVPADEQRIMDGGEKVLEEHYSTVVDATNAATKPVTFGL